VAKFQRLAMVQWADQRFIAQDLVAELSMKSKGQQDT
jgi:hypothetical protein